MAFDLCERANAALEKWPVGFREVKFCAMSGDDCTMLCADCLTLFGQFTAHKG